MSQSTETKFSTKVEALVTEI